MRGYSSRRGSRGTRGASKQWLGSFVQGTLSQGAGPAQGFTSLLNNLDIDAAFTEPTLLRSRLTVSIGGTGAASANGVFGLIHMEGNISTPINAARPIADSDADWILWQPFQIITGVAGGPMGNQGVAGFDLDVKSMRKMTSQSHIVFVIETPSGSAGISYQVAARFLFLDP